MKSRLRRAALAAATLVLAASLQGCIVGTVVGTAVDVGIEVAKVPFKVGKAVYDVTTGDDKDKK
ncbi:MAG: hypothetical protein HGA47_02480 [Zoogloea sp.]|nr:hypothetical protein [Zoogloea sp.]